MCMGYKEKIVKGAVKNYTLKMKIACKNEKLT